MQIRVQQKEFIKLFVLLINKQKYVSCGQHSHAHCTLGRCSVINCERAREGKIEVESESESETELKNVKCAVGVVKFCFFLLIFSALYSAYLLSCSFFFLFFIFCDFVFRGRQLIDLCSPLLKLSKCVLHALISVGEREREGGTKGGGIY